MMLIGVLSIASASADDTQKILPEGEVSEVTDSNSKDVQIPDFSPQTFKQLKQNTNVLETMGKMPQYDTQAERQNWLHKLDQSRLIVRNDIKSYVYPKGPVISYGWNVDDYFNVVLYEGIDVTDSQINEIYDVISKSSSKASIQEIPVVFKKSDFPKNDTAAPGYDGTYHNPVIGAIQLTGETGDIGTLGFAAKKSSDGTKGYVTVQHLGTYICYKMYQPTTASGNALGTVSIISDHHADACFVPYSNVAAKIHVGKGNTLPVKSYVGTVPSDSWKGIHIYKSGRTTGVKDGYIKGIEDPYFGMQYYDLVNTSVYSEEGDSGGPYYTMPTSSECKLYGIHKGTIGSYSYFSPISGVKSDLGVIPIVA